MTDNYTVRIGTSAPSDAADYEELLDRLHAAKERDDDGLVVSTVPRDHADVAWNEAVCPCGGIMRWAEAGYVPWHRICDRCGSSYDLHIVTLFLQRDEPADRRASTCTARYVLVDDGTPRKQLPERVDVATAMRASIDARQPDADEIAHGAIYGSWATRARYYRR